jgi:hypothetical protein
MLQVWWKYAIIIVVCEFIVMFDCRSIILGGTTKVQIHMDFTDLQVL